MKKQFVIYFFLGAGLLLFLLLFIHSEKEKRAYESYLSVVLVNKIVGISQSALYNLGILQDVIKTGKLTKVQAGELENGFNDIAMDTQDLRGMGEETDLLRDYDGNDVIQINSNYSFFLYRISIDHDEIKLTEEQIENLKKMEKLMQEYHKVVKDTFEITGKVGEKGVSSEFWELYREKGITDDYWIKLLKGYARVTDRSYSVILQ
ncbi:hypothetical protein J5Y03_10925 [Bacillus sp. RG28]|uniref:Uncharacterized protein n=1 Tax=Gottfriedia endophytica TaxID=2820819 RepID=A0A940NP08_9BACI|nr:hypothetical protein [Gottfriedia endophytica]MBP0725684.1 hypothetical protein [Gottfriedia endophytica]